MQDVLMTFLPKWLESTQQRQRGTFELLKAVEDSGLLPRHRRHPEVRHIFIQLEHLGLNTYFATFLGNCKPRLAKRFHVIVRGYQEKERDADSKHRSRKYKGEAVVFSSRRTLANSKPGLSICEATIFDIQRPPSRDLLVSR